MTKILLIRHATTDAVGHSLSGRLPGVHLNAAGMEQAEHLADRLGNFNLAEVYCSPLERAVETAKPLLARLNRSCIIEEAFIELDYGKWTNLSFKEVEDDPQFKLYNTFRSNTRIPGGEMMLQAQARMVSGLEKVAAKHPEQTIAVISHSDMIKSAIAHFAGMHLDLMQRIEISPASVSIVDLYAETARILLLNG
jgi:probable phosphomutase (TIGR03848 family)